MSQVTISYLDWVVEGSESRVVSAAKSRVLGSHVHFQVLEKVVILFRTSSIVKIKHNPVEEGKQWKY